jgi:hypothetical protein
MSYYELRRGLVQIGATRRLQALETFVAQCRVWEVSEDLLQAKPLEHDLLVWHLPSPNYLPIIL